MQIPTDYADFMAFIYKRLDQLGKTRRWLYKKISTNMYYHYSGQSKSMHSYTFFEVLDALECELLDDLGDYEAYKDRLRIIALSEYKGNKDLCDHIGVRRHVVTETLNKTGVNTKLLLPVMRYLNFKIQVKTA